ncbi:MAG: hypothetical protein JWQ96_1759 [Segetibacter sp.]|nr:hypothetical protein [Segetibacter sp.]
MEIEQLEQIIKTISIGDTQFAEALFSKPGGRKYLENIVLVILCATPSLQDEKEDLYMAFTRGLNKIEKRIKHQRQGQKILNQLYD